jgi:hypothetical protein
MLLRKALLVLLLIHVAAAQAEPDQTAFEKQAQTAIKEFAGQLKTALMAAMQNGGPVEAISVCKMVAPNLAAEMSRKYDMSLRRTSLKVRNPANEADAWETDVLQRFETRLATGEAIQKLRFSEKIQTPEGPEWRLMKAIPTDKVCLSCHGSKIAPPVQAALDANYPDDLATGYKLGDIRGGFSVRKALSE